MDSTFNSVLEYFFLYFIYITLSVFLSAFTMYVQVRYHCTIIIIIIVTFRASRSCTFVTWYEWKHLKKLEFSCVSSWEWNIVAHFVKLIKTLHCTTVTVNVIMIAYICYIQRLKNNTHTTPNQTRPRNGLKKHPTAFAPLCFLFSVWRLHFTFTHDFFLSPVSCQQKLYL